MWGNWEVAALVEWLHRHNQSRPSESRVGFYGLDVYSLWESLEAVLYYVEQQGDGAVTAARQAFRCFESYSADPQQYAPTRRGHGGGPPRPGAAEPRPSHCAG